MTDTGGVFTGGTDDQARDITREDAEAKQTVTNDAVAGETVLPGETDGYDDGDVNTLGTDGGTGVVGGGVGLTGDEGATDNDYAGNDDEQQDEFGDTDQTSDDGSAAPGDLESEFPDSSVSATDGTSTEGQPILAPNELSGQDIDLDDAR
jgi:hypothetical protein